MQLPLHDLGIQEGHQVNVKDLITENVYIWDREWNFVELNPKLPFHIFKITK